MSWKLQHQLCKGFIHIGPQVIQVQNIGANPNASVLGFQNTKRPMSQIFSPVCLIEEKYLKKETFSFWPPLILLCTLQNPSQVTLLSLRSIKISEKTFGLFLAAANVLEVKEEKLSPNVFFCALQNAPIICVDDPHILAERIVCVWTETFCCCFLGVAWQESARRGGFLSNVHVFSVVQNAS